MTIKLSCLHSPETTMIPSDIVSTSNEDYNLKFNVTSNMKNNCVVFVNKKNGHQKAATFVGKIQ